MTAPSRSQTAPDLQSAGDERGAGAPRTPDVPRRGCIRARSGSAAGGTRSPEAAGGGPVSADNLEINRRHPRPGRWEGAAAVALSGKSNPCFLLTLPPCPPPGDAQEAFPCWAMRGAPQTLGDSTSGTAGQKADCHPLPPPRLALSTLSVAEETNCPNLSLPPLPRRHCQPDPGHVSLLPLTDPNGTRRKPPAPLFATMPEISEGKLSLLPSTLPALSLSVCACGR